jgi:diguanylate cyclase (GGDEF)-like protein
VGNYRLLDSRLQYEVTRHRRNGRPLSLVVLDLDGFKQVNDTLGHPVGDQLLRQVAEVLRAAVREQDTVVRQGGDEFCVIAPETGRAEAEALAGRIKVGLHALVANGEPLSASTGHATFPDDATSAEVLLAHADLEQRRDKATGRGRALLRAVR